MNTIHLIGAEDVQRAGRNIGDAAQTMRLCAAEIESSLERQRMFMDDWLRRFEYVVSCMPKGDQ